MYVGTYRYTLTLKCLTQNRVSPVVNLVNWVSTSGVPVGERSGCPGASLRPCLVRPYFEYEVAMYHTKPRKPTVGQIRANQTGPKRIRTEIFSSIRKRKKKSNHPLHFSLSLSLSPSRSRQTGTSRTPQNATQEPTIRHSKSQPSQPRNPKLPPLSGRRIDRSCNKLDTYYMSLDKHMR